MTFAELLLEFFGGVQPLTMFLALYLGLVAGSFLNVVIYRLPLQRSIVLPGSGCGSCGVPLKWWNNLPVISYLAQLGRCSFCGAPYSSRYMWIEVLIGLSSLGLLFFDGGFGWLWLFHFTLVCVAVAVFFTDIDHWIIPDEVNLFGVVAGIFLSWKMPYRADCGFLFDFWGLQVQSNWVGSLLGVAVGWMVFRFVQFLGMLVARQEAMGWGDVKYAAALGAFLGWQHALLAFLLSFFLGALFAVPLLLSREGRGKEPIPFGTFMSVAAVAVIELAALVDTIGGAGKAKQDAEPGLEVDPGGHCSCDDAPDPGT